MLGFTRVLFSQKLASRRCNFAVLRLCQIGQTKTALQNCTFIYNHSYLAIFRLPILSACLFFDCLQELDLSWFGRLCFDAVINHPGVGVAIAKVQHPRTFVVGSSTSMPPKSIVIISSKDRTPLPLSERASSTSGAGHGSAASAGHGVNAVSSSGLASPACLEG